MPATLFCRLCGCGCVPTGDVPAKCPTCGRETKWGTAPPASGVSDAVLVFNVNDRRFLRAIRIQPD